MHIGSSIGKIKIFFNKLNKGVRILVVTLAIAGLGFGAYAAVRAISALDANTTISKKSEHKIYYGVDDGAPWNTYVYTVKVGNVNHDAMCLDAVKSSPNGSGKVLNPNATAENIKKLKQIMLVTIKAYSDESIAAGGFNFYNDFSNWFTANYTPSGSDLSGWPAAHTKIRNLTTNQGTGNSAAERTYAMGHMLASGIYSEEWHALNTTEQDFLNNTLYNKYIKVYFSNLTTQLGYDPTDYFVMFVTKTSDAYQPIGWLEYNPPTRIRICKKSDENNPLGGAIFTVGGVDYTTRSISGADGDGCTAWIVVSSAGSISYKEKEAPSGYVAYTANQTCTAVANTDTTCNAHENSRITTKIKILKRTTDNQPLAHVKFNVYKGNSTSQSNLIDTFETGNDGYTPCFAVDPGVISFVEIEAPSGYVMDTSKQTTTVAEGTTCETSSVEAIKNRPVAKAKIQIKKVDAETERADARGKATIEGTVFSVKTSLDAATDVTTIVIGQGGIGISGDLEEGTYYIVEKTPGTGYNSTNGVMKVTIGPNDNGKTLGYTTSTTATCKTTASSSCIFKDTIKKGSIKIMKKRNTLSKNTPTTWTEKFYENVSFRLVNKNDKSITYTLGPTAQYGRASLSGIIYGDYTLTEIQNENTPNLAYSMYSTEVSITEDGQLIDLESPNPVVNTIPDNPSLSTKARNSSSTYNNPSSELEISDSASVTDRITCSGLTASHRYKLEGELWPVGTSASNPVSTGTKEFTSTSAGKCPSALEMVLASFDTTDYLGRTLSIKQYLYKYNGKKSSGEDDWVLIAAHNTDLQDANQTVTVKNIGIKTVARSWHTSGSKRKYLDVGTVTLYDYYEILGLTNNVSYELKGTVKNGSTTIATKTDTFTMTLNTGEKYIATMTFENIDTSKYIGKSLHVIQELYVSGSTTPIFVHNIEDASGGAQNVDVLTPTLETSARESTSTSEAPVRTLGVGPNVKIVDTITYTNLVEGDSNYKIKAVLYKLDSNNQPVGDAVQTITVNSFTPNSSNGTADVATFEINTAKQCADSNNVLVYPCKFVVYEYIYHPSNASTPFLTHADPTDTNQIVEILQPNVGTTATRKGTNDHTLPIGNVTVTDLVAYSGLVPGKEYRLEAKLYERTSSGIAATPTLEKTETFHASNTGSGTVTVEFDSFDSTLFYNESAGGNQKKFVVYEKLFAPTSNILIGSHEAPTDDGQTVQLVQPGISTNAQWTDGTKIVGAGDVTIKDTVNYTGLVGGEWYQMESSIYNPATSSKVTLSGGGTEARSDCFQANSSGSGDVAIDINLNTAKLQGKQLIVYERLYRCQSKHDDGRLLAVHEEDLGGSQTISVKTLRIGTTAENGLKDDHSKVIEHEDNQVIKDIVSYENLLENHEYTLYGYLWNKTANAPLLNAENKLITASETFTTTTGSSTREMEFPVDAHALPGVEIVVFEYLFDGNKAIVNADGTPVADSYVASHADANDAGQTIRVPVRVGTTATDEFGNQTIGVGKVKVIDNFEYEGLVQGKKYKVKGWLVDKETGAIIKSPTSTCVIHDTSDNNGGGNSNDQNSEPADDDSGEGDDEEETSSIECTVTYKDVVLEKVFTIDGEQYEAPDGSVPIILELDTRELIGKKLVVFEELYLIEGNTETFVADHKDIDDKDQTVTVDDPVIHTTAVDKEDGDHELMYDTDITIVDRVEYSGLVPGTTYTLYGQLVDKNTGKPISGGITEVTHTFVAEKESGFEEIEFTINTTGMSGQNIVVFESLYIDEYIYEAHLLDEHKDLKDEAQTVWVKVKKPDSGFFTRLSDGSTPISLVIIASTTVLIGASFFITTRIAKRKKMRL